MNIPQPEISLRSYLLNILPRAETNRRIAGALGSWLVETAGEIPIEWPPQLIEDLAEAPFDSPRMRRRRGPRTRQSVSRNGLLAEERQIFAMVTDALSSDWPEAEPGTDTYLQNIDLIGRDLGLSEAQTELLRLLAEASRLEPLGQLIGTLSIALRSAEVGLSAILGRTPTEISEAVYDPGKGMLRTGLIAEERGWHHCDAIPFTIESRLRKVLFKHFPNIDSLSSAVLGRPSNSQLAWEDFEHLHRDGDRLVREIDGALRGNAQGFNLLLYGPVGTGKTEFAKALGKKLGKKVYSVGEADEEGREPSSYERIASLLFTTRLLSKQSDAIVLFDEAEDILTRSFAAFGEDRSTDSKIYINRLLEENETPIIWTANSPQLMGKAFLRRMNDVVKIGLPNAKVRKRLLLAASKRFSFAIDELKMNELAQEFPVPPALLSKGVETASLANASHSELGEILSNLAEATGFVRLPRSRWDQTETPDFNPHLLNLKSAVLSTDQLLQKLKRTKARNWSICLSGPPGTGKSFFLQHLARELEMEPLLKRASDLLSMYVGGTEALIAEAFREAAHEEKFLIIDEADSFLQDRRGAVRSWEVTQVNELLTQMEAHQLPFGMTTNLVEGFDQAALRRLTFKLEADFLTESQSLEAFRTFFGIEPPQKAEPLRFSTPGDYTVVMKRSSALDIGSDASLIWDMLKQEIDVKEDARKERSSMGFGR